MADTDHNASGRWQKGNSGNPAGRPKGIVDRRSRIAAAFEGAGDELAQIILAKARDGDMQAAALVLQRISPPLKRRGERVRFDLDATKPLAQQSAAVVQAMADGALSPDEAQAVNAALASHAALVQYDTFDERLKALERDKAQGARGGVVFEGKDDDAGVAYGEDLPGAPVYPADDEGA